MQRCEPIAPVTRAANLAAFMLRFFLLLALLLAAPYFAGCRHNDQVPEAAAAAGTQASAPLVLSSSSLQNSQYPRRFTCDGEDSSPTLAWTAPPQNTRSLVLTVTDPDASTFTHWV